MSRPLCTTAISQPGEPGWLIWTVTAPNFNRSLELQEGLSEVETGYYLASAGVCDLAPPLPLPEPSEPPPPDISLTLAESQPDSPPPAATAISGQQLVLGCLGLLTLIAVVLAARWTRKPIRQRRPKNLDLGD
jgi:hypothetical protein